MFKPNGSRLWGLKVCPSQTGRLVQPKRVKVWVPQKCLKMSLERLDFSDFWHSGRKCSKMSLRPALLPQGLFKPNGSRFGASRHV